MTTFDDRENAFESKFAHDEALRFKANARRNRLLGVWVAERIGLESAQVDEYARSVVLADFSEPGDEDVFRKVRGDLDATVSDEEIRTKMNELMARAVKEIQTG